MHAQESHDAGNAFAIPDLWKLSALTIEPEDPVTRPWDQFGLGEVDLKNPQLFPTPKDIGLNLPDIDHFHYGALDELPTPESVSNSELDALQLPRTGDDDDDDDNGDEAEDLWITVGNDDPRTRAPINRTWERFYNHDFVESTTYLSEAGSRAFHAALGLTSSNSLVVRTKPVLRALFSLGLGQESVLFKYNKAGNTFSARHENIAITGLSVELTREIVKLFATTGGRFRNLQSFVQNSYSSPSSSTEIAIAETVSNLITALNQHLVQSCTTVYSVLQLQASFRQPELILDYLYRLIERIRVSREEHSTLSELYHFAEDSECREPWARPLTLQILSRVSAPWLDSLNACLGLKSDCVDEDLRRRIRRCAQQFVDGEEPELALAMPSFITGKELETVLQTCHSLEVLHIHSKRHGLLSWEGMRDTDAPSLTWHSEWNDIERISNKAKRYETRVLQALREARSHHTEPAAIRLVESIENGGIFSPYGTTDARLKSQISESLARLQQIRDPNEVWEHDPLRHDLQQALLRGHEEAGEVPFAPPISLLPSLSFWPIVSSQARLVNHACLRMLFEEHRLTLHLQLQRRFHLFGDGMFAMRLSQALFDPSLESAERRKGHSRAGTMGLRLGSRSTWPPASSELRLALMGILTETYRSSSSDTFASSNGTDLPGNLSFALRDLSEAEIERCLDPGGLEALDFLRLRYQPPAPLDAILTPSSLDKYDRIFKLLLRVQRLVALTAQRARSSLFHRGTPNPGAARRFDSALATRMRFEAGHFVTTIADYFLGVGVGEAWDRFFQHVQALEASLDGLGGSEEKLAIGEGDGLHNLRILHEQALDEVLFALMLRSRQAPVIELLEEIFRLVLRFAAAAPGGEEDEEPGAEATLHAVSEDARAGAEVGGGGTGATPKLLEMPSLPLLYADFTTKVRLFLAVCKGLSERHGYGSSGTGVAGGGSLGPGRTIEQLVLRLEMNGWYART